MGVWCFRLRSFQYLLQLPIHGEQFGSTSLRRHHGRYVTDRQQCERMYLQYGTAFVGQRDYELKR